MEEMEEKFTILERKNETDEDYVKVGVETEKDVFSVNVKIIHINEFRLGVYDELIDLRNHREFSQDRIVGAINLPAILEEEYKTLAEKSAKVELIGFIRELLELKLTNCHLLAYRKIDIPCPYTLFVDLCIL